MYSIKTLLAHARHNFKIIAGYNLVAAAGLLVLIPLLFSFRYIDYTGMAYVGEYFLSISGILLITHIGNIEEGYGIEDVVYSKVTPHVFTFITRLVISFWLTFAAVGIVAVAARMSGACSCMEDMGRRVHNFIILGHCRHDRGNYCEKPRERLSRRLWILFI